MIRAMDDRPLSEDYSELSRAELRAGRISWDYMSGDDHKVSDAEWAAAYASDEAPSVDEKFWHGAKVALGMLAFFLCLAGLFAWSLFG